MIELREYLICHPQLRLEFYGNDILVYGIKLSEFECASLYWENNILAKGITQVIDKYFTYSMKSVLISNFYPIKHPIHTQEGIIFIGCKLRKKPQNKDGPTLSSKS